MFLLLLVHHAVVVGSLALDGHSFAFFELEGFSDVDEVEVPDFGEHLADGVDDLVAELEEDTVLEFFDGEIVGVESLLAVDAGVFVVVVEKTGNPSSE